MGNFYSKSLLLFLFLIIPFFFNSVFAASLKFDPSSASVAVGSNTEIKVVVDAGTDQIVSTDAYINYDANLVDVVSVNTGNFFQEHQKLTSTPGKIYIAGMLTSSGETRTGSGVLATIVFKGKSTGTVNLTFDCTQGSTIDSNIGKNDTNVVDIITCSDNGTGTISVGGSSSSSSSSSSSYSGTPAPTALPQTGDFDKVLKYSIPGSIFLLIGGAMLFL